MTVLESALLEDEEISLVSAVCKEYLTEVCSNGTNIDNFFDFEMGDRIMCENKWKNTDLIENLHCFVETIWEIDVEEKQIYFWYEPSISEWERTAMDLNVFHKIFLEQYVYEPDQEKWMEIMSWKALSDFMKSDLQKKQIDIRIIGGPFDFEWNEISLFRPKGGREGSLLILGKNINRQKRSMIIEQAICKEYDYVAYLEAEKNSYILYEANKEFDTPLPAFASMDYFSEAISYNREHLLEWEQLTENMKISNVLKELENSDEYILYCTLKEGTEFVHKKLCFRYYDRERKILLLMRTDVSEISEERRQKEILQEAFQAANVANKAKSEFLSRMSHDIRTPMNAIIGMTAIAATYIQDPDRVKDCLEKITSSSKLLLSLINEVLDMSKIESGRVILSEEEFNLGHLLQNLVSMIQPDITKKHHRLDVHLFEIKNEEVIGDIQRLQQILMNLFSNAIKYTKENGRILFEVSELDSKRKGYGCYQFVVEDNGIGMKEEFLKKIFKPFERADDKEIRAIQGTGLGMAISQNMIEMMNGEIQVESVYGKGSRFVVTLHLQLQNQKMIDTRDLLHLPVLIADDDQVVCESICTCLKELGMESHWVISGEEALAEIEAAHARKEDYFAAILDLKMLGINGIETTRLVRKKLDSNVPIIILSAYDCAEYEIEAKRAGADAFISKPLFKSKLVYLLKKFALKEEVEETGILLEIPNMDYSGKTILLVEDNELNLEIVQEILTRFKITVEIAENGKEAVHLFQTKPEYYYDLIFMDVQMPIMNGYEAAQQIRASEREDSRKIPIVAMTANVFAEDVKKAKESGMDCHLAKPIDLSQMMTVLKQWLGIGSEKE